MVQPLARRCLTVSGGHIYPSPLRGRSVLVAGYLNGLLLAI
jgi:hypothetical protein